MERFPSVNYQFWADLWTRARADSPMIQRNRLSQAELVAHWNRRAKGFSRMTEGREMQMIQARVFAFLDSVGAIQPAFSVLDIGAGPGNFTLPLAQKTAHVAALEPASEMVRIAKAQAEAQGLDNVEFITQSWEDIPEKTVAGQYDLVFASMSPGISTPAMTEKMVKACRGFCFLSGFAGPRWRRIYGGLWKAVFEEEMGDNPTDFIYPLSLIYAMGYRPELRFYTTVWNQEPENITDHYLRFLERYTPITPAVEKRAKDYVNQLLASGEFEEKIPISNGMMVWQVA